MTADIRTGFGYDAHRLVPDRPLVLGGVDIPHSRGLFGHSDADVLTHALCDALLGALALGDIGTHFPDTDSRYKGISSITLLASVIRKINAAGWGLENADITLVAQRPKISPFIPDMRRNLAEACAVDIGRMSIKATTTEGMGFAGTGEGMAAYAVVLIRRSEP